MHHLPSYNYKYKHCTPEKSLYCKALLTRMFVFWQPIISRISGLIKWNCQHAAVEGGRGGKCVFAATVESIVIFPYNTPGRARGGVSSRAIKGGKCTTSRTGDAGG